MRTLYLIFLLVGVLILVVYAAVRPPPTNSLGDFAKWAVLPALIVFPFTPP